MPTWGNCSLVASPYGTVTGVTTFLRVNKRNLPEPGLVDKVRVRLSNPANPSPNESNYKCVVYSDSANYPAARQGISGIETQPNNTAKAWVEFTFSPALDLPAGNYWLGVVRDGGNGKYEDIGLSGGVGRHAADAGGDFYNNPPATYPGGAFNFTNIVWLCGDYTATSNPYPTSELKKNLVSGFHCFMSAYIRAKVTGYDPLKLPDGTIF